MHVFGQGLRQPVRQGRGHDGAVVVLLLLVATTQLGAPEAAGDGEQADVVHSARLCRGHKVGEAEKVLLGRLRLLPQAVQGP